MGDKCQNQQQMHNPWQYPQQYGMYNAYAGQTYGQTGYPHQGYFYYQDMGYNMNAHNQMQHMQMNNGMMNKQYSPGFGQSAGNVPACQQGSDGRKDEDRSDMPPLPPGPAPPTSIANYPSPPPPGTVPIEDHSQFFNQPTNCTYGPIKFNLPGKKTGLGFNSSFGGGGGGGGGKKRRKKKNNQFNNISFGSMGAGAIYPHLPPLPAEAPPLPPLPQDPAPPPPPPGDGPEDGEGARSEGGGPPADQPQPVPQPVPQPAAAVPAVVSAPAVPANDWPESLRNYVNRCYAKCVETVDKDQVEIILKGKITRAANDGSLWIKNWDLEPLPSLHSERKFIEIKKKSPVGLVPTPGTPRPQGQQQGQGPRKSGLSSTLSSRLGARSSVGSGGRGGRRSRTRSRSRSRSPGFRRRNRSRSSEASRSPARHRKAKSNSSSSSDENYKPLRVTKGRDGVRVTDRLSFKPRNNKQNKNKNKQNKGMKSHIYSEFGVGAEASSEVLQKRAARFSASLRSPPQAPAPRRKKPLSLASSVNNTAGGLADESAPSGDIDWSQYHIVGTCQDVEKAYLRLTAAPDASVVRPLDVLRAALVNVQERWKKNCDYRYACDQMKSIRQDLTVQGVRDDFTVEVYETHARIALENGDHEEFNQCQTQLKMLYTEVGSSNEEEFLAYRILYYMFTRNTQDLTSSLATLKPADKDDECVRFALALRSAWWLGNYHRFFKLYPAAPRMSSYLVDWFIERERKSALKAMIKSYRQVLPISFVARELGFVSEEGVGWEEKFHKFLAPFALTFSDASKTLIDCRQSVGTLTNF